MARAKKNAKPVKKPLTPEQLERRRRAMWRSIHATAISVVLGLFFIGYTALGRHVMASTIPQHPAGIVLIDQPAWMTDAIAAAIVEDVRPTLPRSLLERELLENVHDRLAVNPWVEGVESLRRTRTAQGRDAVEVRCRWRMPLALVRWRNEHWLVSAEAVVLPLEVRADWVKRVVEGRDAQSNVRVITGVTQPPPGEGKVWAGDDLKAGLDLAALLAAQPAAQDVTVIDVSNVTRARRDAPQVTLVTKANTHIYWGRPIHGSDFLVEVPPDQKLAHLEALFARFGARGNYPSWADVRGDVVRYFEAGS